MVDRPQYAEQRDYMEEALRPILSYIENPTRITFEDEIILIVKTMIKKSQIVSPIQWEMFD